MKNKNKFLILLVFAIFFAGAGTVLYYFFHLPQIISSRQEAVLPDPLFGWKFPENLPATSSPSTITGQNLFDFQIAFSSIRDPGGIPSGLPVRLQIPVIGVNSAIEDALITQDGRMDVPAGSVNVAWFALGPHPGQIGSAVIGGHFGISKGVKFVFYDLDKLKIGDNVYILDDGGNTLAFRVRMIKSFDRNADATPVFTSGDGLAHLNLITCEGIWNQINGTYPQRRVVFTDAIPPEGAVAVKPTLPSAGKPIPASAPKPTPTAMATAAPVTLPAPIILPPISAPIVSPQPATPIPVAATPSTLAQTISNLYATPTDGIVTSLLLLAIFFLFFKIIKR